MLAVLLVGTEAKGAQRWLTIPGVTRFQPSEIMKLVMPLLLYIHLHLIRFTKQQLYQEVGLLEW